MSSEPLVKKTNVGFPVFALQWQDNSSFIASGGGGSSRSGVKNKIIIGRVDEGKDDDGEVGPRVCVVCEHILAQDEDAPMTLAVTPKGTIITGINQSAPIIKEKSQNKHLRIFETAPSPADKPKLVLKSQKQILPLNDANGEHYQRLTRLSPGGGLLAAASSAGDLAIVSFPQLEPVYFTKVEDDIFGLDFSPADNDTIAYVTTKTLRILPFRDSKRTRLQNKKTFHSLSSAASKSATYETTKSFRNVKFLTPTKVVATVNDRTAKKAYWGVYVLNAEKGWKELKLKAIGKGTKGVVGLDYCAARKVVGVSTSDIAVQVFHAETFNHILTIDKVADFTLTQIAFNPSGTYIATSSVANTISLIPVPADLDSTSKWKDNLLEAAFYLIGLLVVFVAVNLFVLLRSRAITAQQ